MSHIDPALRPSIPASPQAAPFSTLLSTTQSTPPTLQQQTLLKGKLRCGASSCGRQATASCTKEMCKACCIRGAGVCNYKGHNNGLRAVSTSDDPLHMPRPLPALPLRSAKNERRIKHAVLLVSYVSDDATPSFLPLQDIKTWPTLNLASLLHLRSQLGLNTDDIAELYISTTHGKFWIPTLDYSMTVKTDEKIFIRRKGILTTQHPSTFFDPLAFAQQSTILSPGPQTPRKRARDSDSATASLPSVKRLCFGFSPEVESALSSPCPVLPALLSAVPVPVLSDTLANEDLVSDQLWESGSVLTPTQLGDKWPQKMYARDMAQAFAFLKDATDTGELSDRFSRVFNGSPWKSSTYHLNRRFWEALPEHIKQEARTLPRDPVVGLWTAWRKGKPGWNSAK
ncbi:hypothetical protein GALMADRAFT_80225 [Galerina marginata CBS 339.88]|uniref:Uncharacterized protein n=1 Tax=Galerina marginata (strain CBS 339.88) TaxID=685588 RepID=A0A067SAN5_GALM3|nr:hypothetical protein GALMADRAFT_80225 [Galerina marginata CBS 339.88]